MRIAIGGFQHETNTFAPTVTEYDDFVMADSWPGLTTGQDVITVTKGMNLPITGAIETALANRQSQDQITLMPLVWCAAEPGGYVTDDAFDRISTMICDGLDAASACDGIYLDLHGAMVTSSYFDGEGELLRRIRSRIGHQIPIAISLDLHANITQQMVDLANVITIYRTYPHLDMAETGSRAMAELLQLMAGDKIYPAFRQVPFLIALPAQYTGHEPCQSIYGHLAHIDGNQGAFADLAMGFSASDIPDCGASVLAYASTPAQANDIADEIWDMVMSREADFDPMLIDPYPAVKAAMASTHGKPVILADVQDNPGAGGSADTTGLLKALYESHAENVVMGVICDQDFVKAAHEAGIGNLLNTPLGGQSAVMEDTPFEGCFTVEALHDGRFTYTGDMYGGGEAEIGLSCLVSIHGANNIHLVVSSYRTQCLDQCFFTSFGIDLTSTRIIALKSTVHYRADFEHLASQIIHVASPGLFECRLNRLPYRHLRDGVRIGN